MLKIKSLLFLLPFIIGCNQPVETPEEFIEEVEECIHIGESDFSKDSILELADRITDHMKNQSSNKIILEEQIAIKEYELQEIKIHEKLSEEQITFLQNEEQQLMYKIEAQQHVIENLRAPKDTTIYNIQYEDTIVKKPIYVNDTVYIQIEITDTIFKTVKRKRCERCMN